MLVVSSNYIGGSGANLTTNPVMNRFMFDVDPGLAGNVASTVRQFYVDLNSLLSQTVTVRVSPNVRQVDPATGQTVTVLTVAPAPADVVGTNVGTLLPDVAQARIDWLTGSYLDGRAVRGRTYIYGLTTNAILSGDINSTTVTALSTAAANLRASGTLSIYHVARKPVPPHRAVVHVTGHVITTEFRSLRRRIS